MLTRSSKMYVIKAFKVTTDIFLQQLLTIHQYCNSSGHILLRSIWALTSAFLLCCFVAIADSQEHRFPTTRRRLPTVIITREHLRQQQRTPSLYGPIGDTAAEFVVSAGLDDRQSSAVRIRKIGSNDGSNRRNNGDNISLRNNAGSNRRDDVHAGNRNNFESNSGNIQVNQRNNVGSSHRENFSNSRRHNMDGNRRNNFVGNNAESNAANDTSSNEVNDRHQVISVHHRRRPELRPVNFANDRNRGNGPQVLSSDGRQPHPYNRQEVFNPQIVGVSVERRHPELHPQANRRRQDIHHQRNRVGDSQRFYPAVNVNFERGPQQYVPPIFVPNYQTHRNGQPIIPTDQRGYVNSRPTVNSKPVYIGEPNEKTESISNPSPNASPAIVTEEKRVHATSEDNRDPVLKTNDDEVKDDIKKAPHKHIVAETPVLRLKPADAQKYLIRRPSLVLTDQITVNEVRGPRFGPRSLEHDQEESTTGSRQKRRAPSSLYSLAHVELNRTTGHSKKALHGFRDRGQRKSKSHPFRNYSGHQDTSSNSSTFTKPSLFDTRTPYYSDEFVSDQSSDSSSKQSDLNDEDVMSFSDFLASPIAEKIRLERQKMFRNSSRWTSDPNDYSYPNSTVDLESSMENTSVPALQEMIAAKLLHNILSINNSYSELVLF
ncbi:hypothetical protein JTE90_001676 [Oedothorax gibbosus]|uniref:Uncharacterized protein n=1 Tax=Oedothorax gibbosus TaxID=931172 RepID=A0AAV6UH44_9ARAC|nr:hypothetical protein JTE90_001676 [Oedothorax gibbosus]